MATWALLLGLLFAIDGARAAPAASFHTPPIAPIPDMAKTSSSLPFTTTVSSPLFLPYLLNQQLTHAQLHPSPILSAHNLAKGDFTLDIVVRDVLELSQFAFSLHYDPNIVQALDAHIGPLLLDTGRNVAPVGPFIDNSAGVIHFSAVSSGAAPGASGTGIIATIDFRPQLVGKSWLSWSDVSMINTSAHAIPVQTQVGSIAISFFPITATPTPSPSPTPSVTPTATPTPVLTPTATPTATPTPTSTPTPLPGVGLLPSPLQSTHSLGAGAFTLDIETQNVLDLGAFQFTLHFDPVILQSQTAYLGPFLSSSGRTALPLAPIIDNTAGTITFGGFSFGSQPGASGSGSIAHLEFLTLRNGATILTWSDDILTDTQANGIAHTSLEGEIIITP
ncbi:MAG: hypothetical protein GXP37_07845 [Chloroflexi bacterium]|nr:hypothetical protein [Chloroflexota bacterium]